MEEVCDILGTCKVKDKKKIVSSPFKCKQHWDVRAHVLMRLFLKPVLFKAQSLRLKIPSLLPCHALLAHHFGKIPFDFSLQ